jgi:tyrosyl-tRNA synthetase
MPTTEIGNDKLKDGKIGLLNLLVLCGLAPSNKQARQLVLHGGISINNEKIVDSTFMLTETMLKEGIKIRKGRRVFHKAILI